MSLNIVIPEVTALLEQLLSHARDVLGYQFAGMYLYGSLATGDFDPATSDIDFVVATHGELSGEIVAALEAMHAEIAQREPKWGPKLEGAYIPLEALRRHDAATGEYPCVNEGAFYLAGLGSDWMIQRHVLRDHDARLAGPVLRDLIDPVAPESLRRSVCETLREWWAPMLEAPDPRMAGGAYGAYAVLSMCRALHTLETGEIASKRASARWALETLDARWRPLIEQAAAWRPGAPMAGQDVTLEFMRWALAGSRVEGA
jgi:predicted nucleotidyltransferase